MNKERRKALAAISIKIQDAFATLANLKDDLESVMAEEQDGYDNLPESFQYGDKGEAMQAAITAMETAIEAMDIDTGEITNAIDEAMQ